MPECPSCGSASVFLQATTVNSFGLLIWDFWVCDNCGKQFRKVHKNQ